jgi:ribonucleoside-diphosphate reductase alpha chain
MSEITLFNDTEHTFTCVLSSINAANWNQIKGTDKVYWSTIFLDCIAAEFIQKAKGVPGLEKAVRFTEKSRALGLGLCGLHTYFLQEGIPFESFEAHRLNMDIQYEIDKESLRASKDLAEIFGEPDWCKGLGVRNSHRMAIAPTKSTAALLGGVSEGINPDPAMVYTQTTAAGEVPRINAVFLKVLKKYNKYDKSTLRQIQDANGSVQGLDFLSEDEKLLFRTAFEMDQSAILRMASGRARYLDQWQSLNLFFSADEDPAYIAKIHQQAFEDESILGLYYVYTQAGVQASKEECLACQ